MTAECLFLNIKQLGALPGMHPYCFFILHHLSFLKEKYVPSVLTWQLELNCRLQM